MIKRYFFIAGVRHESDSGEWMMADEVNAEINTYQNTIGDLTEHMDRQQAKLERLEKIISSFYDDCRRMEGV